MSNAVNYVGTRSGKHFDFINPEIHMVDIEDIAYSLARLPRWNGQSKEIITVAQHCVMVSRMLQGMGYPPYIQYQGLLHDAAEAYLGDVPSPIKKHLPDFVAMELLCEDVIFEALGCKYPLDPVVKMMDNECYRWEYRDLMVGDACKPPLEPRPHLTTWSTAVAEGVFLEQFDQLIDAIGYGAGYGERIENNGRS